MFRKTGRAPREFVTSGSRLNAVTSPGGTFEGVAASHACVPVMRFEAVADGTSIIWDLDFLSKIEIRQSGHFYR